jgi:ABC-type nitrate/sulfonate/bicarbonate transport system permease component
MKNFFPKFVGLFTITIIWFFIYQIGVFNQTLFPSPINTFIKLFSLLVTPNIYLDIGWSLIRMGLGYLGAALTGILLGLIIGKFTFLFKSSEIIIDFFRSIPVTTLYPVFVLMFGIDHFSKIAMVFWSSFFVILLNTSYGVVQSNKTRYLMSDLFGAKKIQIFRWVVFYDALPQTLIGLRVALSFSIIVEILCEMFMGSEFGIGQKITEAFTTYNITELYALILLSGFIGYALNRLFVIMEKKLVPWVYYGKN